MTLEKSTYMEITRMPIHISNHRIDTISNRCDFPIISKLILETILNLEGEKKECLNYRKFYTNLYRLPKTNLVQSLNSAAFDSITKTLSKSDFEFDEDKRLRKELIQYWKIKNAKFSPLPWSGDNDATHR